ncbi:MAG: DUF6783 domain-containing protein [Blautia faecis]|nr:DUF6783 domain-containing protein [Blautia faecis]
MCGRFCPNSVAAAHCGALIRTKSPTNCDAPLAESPFRTRSTASVQITLEYSASPALQYFFHDRIPKIPDYNIPGYL